MKLLKLTAIACSVTALGLAAGAAAAQSSAPSDTQAGSMMQSGKTDSMMAKPMGKMSDSDMKAWKSCAAMSHDAMTKSPACIKLMKSHPDMMKSGGAMTSGGMTPKP